MPINSRFFGRPWGLVLAGLFALTGCGESAPYALAPVSGVITLDGKPVPYTHIVLSPKGTSENPNPGPGSTAECDATGKYVLKTVRGEEGAVVGTHAVQIYAHGPPQSTAGDTDTGPRVKEMFPEQYNSSSTLTFDVPAGGTTTADFKLTTKP